MPTADTRRPSAPGNRPTVGQRHEDLAAARAMQIRGSASMGVARSQHGFTVFPKKKRGGGSNGDIVVNSLLNSALTQPCVILPQFLGDSTFYTLNDRTTQVFRPGDITGNNSASTIRIYVSGAVERNNSYTGGTSHGNYYTGGHATSTETNQFWIYVNSTDTNYWLNPGTPDGALVGINFNFDVAVGAGDVLTLGAAPVDGILADGPQYIILRIVDLG